MSFLPERLIDRYYLLLKQPYGNENGTTEKPTEEQKEEIERWLYKSFLKVPQIPDLFFENRSTQSNNKKKSAVDFYTSINYELHRLENFKKLFFDNLNGLKNEYNSIIFDKSKYNINPNDMRNNLFPSQIINSNRNILQELFFNQNARYSYFPDFIKKYKDNNYNLYSYTGSNSNGKSIRKPFFIKVFEENYNGETKEFMVKLLEEYILIRKGLLKKIEKYYGIIAFKSIFDFQNNLMINIKGTKKQNSFNEEFQAPNVYNEVSLNVSENSKYKTSYHAVYGKNENALENGAKEKKLSNEQMLEMEESYKFMRLKSSNNIYQSYGDENLINTEHRENLVKIFDLLIEKLKDIYNIQFIDLYQLMEISIELDFITIQFIYNFVRPDLFLSALQIKKNVYKFINSNINLYYDYIEEFDMWIYKYLLGYDIEPFGTGDKKFEEVYQTFYNFIMNMFEKTKLERNEEFKNKLVNKGVFVNVETLNQPQFISQPELKEYSDLFNSLSTNK
jgi:hypothetical protein